MRTPKLAALMIAIAILWVASVFTTCTRHPQPASASGGWVQDNKQRAKLADFKGKVVVLDFYATWCEPCRAEIPHLVNLQKQYGDKGLQVIGLNVGGEDDRAQVPGFAKEFGIQYLLAYPDDDLVDQLLSDNQNIPQSFVYDRNGKLIKRFIGFEPSGGAAQIERVVQQALTENTIAGQPANEPKP
jgi:thiol-disulfide isomerase/thioredoxin